MKIAIVGYGKMGKLIKKTIEESKDMECVGVASPEESKDLTDLPSDFDAIIDFSHPDNLSGILSYVEKNPKAVVIATTGFTEEQIRSIEALSQKVPVVYTANFSLGVTVFQQVLKQITPILRDTFDIEIIEKHHRLKLDAPSGTAKMLLSAIDENNEREKVYGREGNSKRKEEIGIHSIRGGTIVGEHTVLFTGDDEVFEITHQAHSKQIFANGAVVAAKFAVKQEPGLYDMNDVLFGKR
ncbi:4-hydroxy-tetrahydrodipicolinate reductase [Sinanaerobacter chloroacetimidivorans]|jgi:4-hydroxy-tetrahydrodipicolinate reductase|uniref:4-hydroxy-tetrahydrodipicolinate reductase n=1 Tax=Sinanaerobacter chloroacetimidivorans TaxID=2818044 RepID=A0A8J8B2P6_9FIRM|nr:4-hydroxy-tetrahydrodipicolinate reductase [Sinanaerobacter chloroacetimidivorans]MBR0598942.1 4-hydroxy-tetrahydrodipicolinate reductase [Sinanaerobacter chloroacetimidivorans]